MTASYHPPTTSHNYLRKQVEVLHALHRRGKTPRSTDPVEVLHIRHDDWCDALNGRGFCNCDPDFVFKGELVDP